MSESERILLPGPAGQQRWELARPFWWTHGPIGLVALLGAIFSGLASLKASEWEQAKVENAFLGASRDRALVIQREIEHTLSVVQDIGRLFAASPIVKRREFRQFVGPSLKRYQAIQALQWVPVVTERGRAEFIAQARQSFPPFQITETGDDGKPRPASTRDFYYPVLYVQPYKLNREVLGFDMGSDPAIKELLEAVADQGQLRVVSTVDVVSSNPSQATLTVYLPVYRNTEIPGEGGPGDEDSTETVEQTPRELQGFVVGTFHTGDMIRRALDYLTPAGIDMAFYKQKEDGSHVLLYAHTSRVRDLEAPDPADSEFRAPWTLTQQIEFFDTRWSVVSSSVPQRFQTQSWPAWLVLFGGLAFTGLLTAYLMTLVGRSEEVRRLVADRTRQLVNAISALKQQIADRRRAEHELQLLNETLEQRVAARTRESRRRADELEQFAYVASHDLKAPLRGIANLASWLEEDLAGKLDPNTREQLVLLRDRVQRMQNLIEGLLEYSRVGRVKGTEELVDTRALVLEIADSLAPPEGFRIDVSPDLPTLQTERLLLGQVFANLISNALKHHGGQTGVIRVVAQQRGPDCEFTVADDGQGIDPRYHDKIFLMFQTLQAKDREGDTGIGLALVQKIVLEQGGSITLESEPGNGACFRFSWPNRN
jgi:signal transduction histidine kinase